MGGKSGSSQRVTRYSLDMHMGLARSMDRLLEVRADGKVFLTGPISSNTEVTINKGDLFGGDKKEGGLRGTLQVLMGGPDQAVYEPLRRLHGEYTPAFRGVATLHYSGQVSTSSTYLKTWDMMYDRLYTGWEDDAVWYPEAMEIMVNDGQVTAMNPAHIVYQANTDTEWGGSIPRGLLDDASYRAAADLYLSEGFGLCFLWQREGAVGEFVQQVLDHVGGAQYVSRSTGLLTLASIRGDYDPEDLPLFDHTTGLLSIDDDQLATIDTAVNQMTVTWYDVLADVDRTVTLDNPALIAARAGGINSQSVTYKGIPDEQLAMRVCQRDLNAAGLIRRLKVTLDRRGRKIPPAGLFRISSPYDGISAMVLRAGQITERPDGTFQITAMQDVFGLPATVYAPPQDSTWVPPDSSVTPAPNQALIELTWRDLVRRLSAADLAFTAEDAAFVGSIAQRPVSLASDYLLYTRWPGEEFALRADATWCATAVLDEQLEATATLAYMTGELDAGVIGSAALLGDEIVRIDDIDLATGTVTLGRGCVDTAPRLHLAGTRIWFADDLNDVVAIDTREYTEGDEIEAVVLTRGSSAVLPIDQATPIAIQLQGRQGRPYAPGQVAVNGHSVLTDIPAQSGELTVSWAHRNRLLQSDLLIDHHAASITPEEGVEYQVLITAGALVLADAGTTDEQLVFGQELELAPTPREINITLTTRRADLDALTIYTCSLVWTPPAPPEPEPEEPGEPTP